MQKKAAFVTTERKSRLGRLEGMTSLLKKESQRQRQGGSSFKGQIRWSSGRKMTLEVEL